MSKVNPELDEVTREKLAEKFLDPSTFLGAGSYARVYRAIRTYDKEQVALKMIDTREKSEYVRKFLPREVSIVLLLRHPHIVRVDRVFEIPNYTCMVTELCENGDLLERIKKMRYIPETDAKFYFRQMIEALKYLQDVSVVHRDLKCENILLDRFDNVKLADFGFARFLNQGQASSTFCGSRVYVAPEVLRAKQYTDNAIDIWSVGIVLYIMVTGVMPYDDRNLRKMVEQQMAHKIRFPRMELSWEVKRLIHDTLHPIPKERLDYEEICASDWLSATPYRIRTVDDCSTAYSIDGE
ncbi:unnamed protein product, partial [Mesorhabditis belari]|uniref:Protein kinase domain-containing protein n=1 Tax=Mesorhabditis belari TaxID=2138241 RepID=A0AAF3ESQ6_9BILA